MDLLAAFIQRYPGVRVAVRMGNATRVLADLEEGRTDLAILNLVQPASGLHRQLLHQDRIVAFVPKSHAWAKRRRLSLIELADAPLVLREPGSATRALLTDAFAAAELTPRVALEFGSREAVREAVLAGLGVGAVFASELVAHADLHILSIQGAELTAHVSLACLAERRELRVVRAFSAVAAEVMAQRVPSAAGRKPGAL